MHNARLYEYIQSMAREEEALQNSVQAGGLVVYVPEQYTGKAMQLLSIDHNRGEVVAEEPILNRGLNGGMCCAIYTGLRPGVYMPVITDGGLKGFLARLAFRLVPTLEPKNFLEIKHDSVTIHDLR
jgi:hypothetical protein